VLLVLPIAVLAPAAAAARAVYQRRKEGSALLTMLPASLRKGLLKVTGS
jgi:hypothetical protein